MKTSTIGISLTLAITAVTIITIMTSSQRESSASNQTMMTISNGNLTSKAANTTETKIGTNIKNVSIVPEATGLEDKAYQPNPVSIKVGETVIWTNNDLTIHTVTEGNPSTSVPTNGFDSGLLNPDETFKHVFKEAGTIEYHCILHPTMTGRVIIS
jgi:nitrite reductase (NO-forming)